MVTGNLVTLSFDYAQDRLSASTFLFNAILFHEVGHIVEHQLCITVDVYNKLKADFQTDTSLLAKIAPESFGSILQWDKTDKNKFQLQLSRMKAFVEEYVCDLFCAQYVGEYAIKYLEYKHHKDFDNKSVTHPTVNERLIMITDFLDYYKTGTTANLLLDYILNQFKSKGEDKALKLRYVDVDITDCLYGKCISCADTTQLYSIFKVGWDKYKAGPVALSSSLGREVSNTEYYELIAGGIKNTIASFFVNI